MALARPRTRPSPGRRVGCPLLAWKPARAGKLTRAQVSAALKRGRRHHIADNATAILTALRSQHRSQPAALTAAYATAIRSMIAVITTLNDQVMALKKQVGAHLGILDVEPDLSGRWHALHATVPGRTGKPTDGVRLRHPSSGPAGTCIELAPSRP